MSRTSSVRQSGVARPLRPRPGGENREFPAPPPRGGRSGRPTPGPAPQWRTTRLLLLVSLLLLPLSVRAVVLDRIAAVIGGTGTFDHEVIAVSEINQMVALRFFPQTAGQSDDQYRREVLDALVAQALRFRDVERFGAPEDIPKGSIEARLQQTVARFTSPAGFNAVLAQSELTLDELRAVIRRQLQVESYVQLRFSPMIFVPNEDIETYYNGTWSQQRRQRGLAIPPLSDVREEIRTLLKSTRLQKEVDKWTTQLRATANVDVFAYR